MKYLYIFLFPFFALPVHVFAEEVNAGFVHGIWYSSTTVIENVPIRIYAALRNNTEREFSGTVRFMDGAGGAGADNNG